MRSAITASITEPLNHPVRPLRDLDPLLVELDRACIAHALLDDPYQSYRQRLTSDRRELAETDFRNRYLSKFWTFLASPQPAVGERQ